MTVATSRRSHASALHLACRAAQPARADDVPPLHPAHAGLLEEAGRSQGRREPVHRELEPLLASLGPPDVSRDARGTYSEGLDVAGSADGVELSTLGQGS